MQHVILGLLMSGSLSSYDVHKRFRAGLSLIYSASFGGIQRALKQLLADGSVTVADVAATGRGTKLYSVTASGRQAWRAWMLDPEAGGDPETTMLAKVYLLGLLETQERGTVVAALRDRVLRELAALSERAREADAADVPAGLEDHFAYQRATLDYGTRAHELALAWLDGVAVTAGEGTQ